MRLAINTLAQREMLNADYRVINNCGREIECLFSRMLLNDVLSNLLTNNFNICVTVSGVIDEVIKNTICECLNKQGFFLTETCKTPDLIVIIEFIHEEENTHNADFKFIQWKANFQVIDNISEKLIGSVGRSGREGHLTKEDTTRRAMIKLQEEIKSEIAIQLCEFIYGE